MDKCSGTSGTTDLANAEPDDMGVVSTARSTIDDDNGSITSVISFRTPTTDIEWHTLDSDIIFSVSYIDVPEYVAQTYMHRYNEEAYRCSCEEKKGFKLTLFPPDNSVLRHFPHMIEVHEVLGMTLTPSDGIKFREEFLHLSRLVKAVRVRRIVLQDKYIKLKNKIRKYEDFLHLCEVKMEAHMRRLSMLENELLLFEPYDNFQCSTLFGSFLSHSTGWSTAVSAVMKEFKYLQSQEENVAVNVKEDEMSADLHVGAKLEAVLRRQGLGLDRTEVGRVWEMMRFWQAVYSVAVRAFLGRGGTAQYKSHSIPKKLATEDLVVRQKHVKKKAPVSVLVVAEAEDAGEALSTPVSPTGVWGEEGGDLTPNVSYKRRESSRVLTPQSGSVKEGGKGTRKGKPDKTDKTTAELANHLQPMLPCGIAGVASWDALCSFFGVDLPPGYDGIAADGGQQEVEDVEVKSLVEAAQAIVNMITSTDCLSSQLHSMAGQFVVPFLSKITISTLIYTMKEEVNIQVESADVVPPMCFILPSDEVLRSLGGALLAVADDIASALEAVLVERFRRLTVWTSLLEGMRRERVKKEGGKISIRDDAEVSACLPPGRVTNYDLSYAA